MIKKSNIAEKLFGTAKEALTSDEVLFILQNLPEDSTGSKKETSEKDYFPEDVDHNAKSIMEAFHIDKKEYLSDLMEFFGALIDKKSDVKNFSQAYEYLCKEPKYKKLKFVLGLNGFLDAVKTIDEKASKNITDIDKLDIYPKTPDIIKKEKKKGFFNFIKYIFKNI